MDIFSSSNRALKTREFGKKNGLKSGRNEVKDKKKLGLFMDDYLTTVERLYIKQQSDLYKSEDYSWILKLNKERVDEVSQSVVFPNNGETDKVMLPDNILQVLSRDESLYPLFFRIKCLNNGCKPSKEDGAYEDDDLEGLTHCGVLNYSEKTGYISLPKKILRCLNIVDKSLSDETIWIEISYKRLSKGTYAQFELLNNNDILEMNNLRSLLETYIRNYFNTLTIGDTIYINQLHNSLNKKNISVIKINKLEPDNCISLINTDIQIDITSSSDDRSNNNSNDRNNFDGENNDIIKVINIGDVEKIGFNNKFKVLIPFELRKKLINNQEKNQKLGIFIKSNCKYEIFVSFPPLFESSSHLYVFRSFLEENSENSLLISKNDIVEYFKKVFRRDESNDLEITFPSVLFIYIEKCENKDMNVYDNNPTIQVKILYNSSNHSNSESKCRNCGRMIPTINLDLHLINCEKVYKLCDLCNLVIKRKEFNNHVHCDKCILSEKSNQEKCTYFIGLNKNELENHNRLYHEYIKCILCNKSVERIKLNIHQVDECQKRIILCRYCNNYVEAGIEGYNADFRDVYYYNLTSHESYCGSRTTNCNLCSKSVLIKDLDSHMELFHGTNDI